MQVGSGGWCLSPFVNGGCGHCWVVVVLGDGRVVTWRLMALGEGRCRPR